MSPKSIIKVLAVTSFSEQLQQIEDRIRVRAYDRFVQRGRGPGRELEDWSAACSDLLTQPAIALSEADGHFVLHVLLPDEALQSLELLVSKTALLLQSSPHPLVNISGIVHVSEFHPRQVFRIVELPQSIAPESIAIESDGRIVRVSAMIGEAAESLPKAKPRARQKAKTTSA